jgi:glycine betaine/proline transport system ATP-binding protein
VIDRKKQFHGVVSAASLEAELQNAEPDIRNAFLPGIEPLKSDAKVGDIITPVAQAPCGLPVVDEKGRYLGVVSRALLLEALNREEAGHA